MGYFTLFFSSALVILQATTIILGRDASVWSFWLVRAVPDAVLWKPALDLLIATNNNNDISIHTSTFSSNFTPNNNYNNNSVPAASSNITAKQPNVTTTTTTTTTNNNSNNNINNNNQRGPAIITQLIAYTNRGSAITCLEMHMNLSKDSKGNHYTNNRHYYYDCLLHGHTPKLAIKALNTWNPHLILFMLCGIHFIICLSHTRFKGKHNGISNTTMAIEEKKSLSITTSAAAAAAAAATTDNNNSNEHGKPIPLQYASTAFFILLVPIIVCQGMHDVDLVTYPTIITMALLSIAGIYFVVFAAHFHDDDRWRLAFHLQMVSVPLAVLGITAAGGRLWFDALSHLVLLSAAVNTLWLQTSNQLHGYLAQSLCRVLTLSLTTLSLYLVHVEFGQFDTWRYVVAYMACVGLAPIYILSLTPSFQVYPMDLSELLPKREPTTSISMQKQQMQQPKIYHNISLMATNAALLSFIVNLGDMSHF